MPARRISWGVLAAMIVLPGCVPGPPDLGWPPANEVTPEQAWREVAQVTRLLERSHNARTQQALIDQARARLPAWYAAADVAPPDTSQPRWLDYVVWDLMPEADFQAAMPRIRSTLATAGVGLPEVPTRRQVAEAIIEADRVMRGEP